MNVQAVLLFVVMGLVTTVRGGFVDDFNGSTLDPAWTLKFSGARADTNWVPTVTNSFLELRDFNDLIRADGYWAYATFSRSVGAVSGDFELGMTFNWQDVGNESLQQLRLSAHTTNGTEVGYIQFYDLRSYERPGYVIAGGGDSMGVGHNGLAIFGSVEARLMRSNGYLTGSWDGFSDTNFVGFSNSVIAEVRLQVAHYGYSDANLFKPMNVDQVSFVAIPEPSVIALFSCAGLLMFVTRRMRRI